MSHPCPRPSSKSHPRMLPNSNILRHWRVHGLRARARHVEALHEPRLGSRRIARETREMTLNPKCVLSRCFACLAGRSPIPVHSRGMRQCARKLSLNRCGVSTDRSVHPNAPLRSAALSRNRPLKSAYARLIRTCVYVRMRVDGLEACAQRACALDEPPVKLCICTFYSHGAFMVPRHAPTRMGASHEPARIEWQLETTRTC